MPIATKTQFTRDLLAARKAETDASRQLDVAIRQATIDPEMQAWALEHSTESWGAMLLQVAGIVARIPALRDAAKSAREILSELEDQACSKCRGTGEYDAPTRAVVQGRAYCFTCGGTGQRK